MSKTILPELIFSVTNQCNHACKRCYYHESLAADMSELSLDEIRRVSEVPPLMKWVEENLWVDIQRHLEGPDGYAIRLVFRRFGQVEQ